MFLRINIRRPRAPWMQDTDLSNVLARRQRPIRVRFNADTSTDMRWQFRPQQSEIKIVPGESALAFYTATNPTDQPITGMSAVEF